MKRGYTQRFLRSLRDAPPHIQKAFDKQAELLLRNPRHPSLRTKKFDEATDVWQARVTRQWRMYFRIEGDTYLFVNITPHPK